MNILIKDHDVNTQHLTANPIPFVRDKVKAKQDIGPPKLVKTWLSGCGISAFGPPKLVKT